MSKGKGKGKSSNAVLRRFRSYGIEATVWAGESEHKRTVTIKKSYKDDDGNYQETTTFFPDELPRLAMVANAAHAFCSLRIDKFE